jgi:MFS transporter, DHA1 family, tetracycline resistance protein
MTKKPSLGAIFLTVFLDLLGFGIVLPFLAEEARDGFHTSAFVGTLLAAVYSLMQFLFVPVWGRLSDRIGRRPVMVVSVAGTFVGMTCLGLALGWSGSVAWLFVARIWSGIATANLGTASAYIADVTPPEERARGMGLIGMAFGLGFILGPGIGGALSDITINGRHGPVACFVAAGLSVVNFVWVQIGLAESLPKEKRSQSTRRLVPLDLKAAREAFAMPGVAQAVLVNFLIVLSFTNLDQTFRFYNKDVFQMSPLQTGLVLAAVGVVAAGVQGGVVRRMSKRYGEAKLIVLGVVLQAIAFGGVAWAPSVGIWALFASMALLAVGNGLSAPSTSAFVSKRADPKAQGNTLGTNQSASSLARTFGPALGGWFYGEVGPRSPYLWAMAGMVVALFFAIRLLQLPPTATADASANPANAS